MRVLLLSAPFRVALHMSVMQAANLSPWGCISVYADRTFMEPLSSKPILHIPTVLCSPLCLEFHQTSFMSCTHSDLESIHRVNYKSLCACRRKACMLACVRTSARVCTKHVSIYTFQVVMGIRVIIKRAGCKYQSMICKRSAASIF